MLLVAVEQLAAPKPHHLGERVGHVFFFSVQQQEDSKVNQSVTGSWHSIPSINRVDLDTMRTGVHAAHVRAICRFPATASSRVRTLGVHYARPTGNVHARGRSA